MNHNSYSSNGENNNQPNNEQEKWQEAMKGVHFQGNTPEKQEKSVSKINKLLGKIKGIKDSIKNKFGSSSNEKIAEMTDEALVYVAKETITAADKDGVRTEAEAAEIEEAVSTAVVQGAMEEAGKTQATGNNPILELNEGDTQSDLMTSIENLHTEGATLPDGESVAGLAVRAIERDKKWDLTKVTDNLGSNEGGWYETPTGERYYVKFYKNPSQGRVEFIANAIYEKLGVKAVRSEIIQLDGREAIASPAVPGAESANWIDQKNSKDVQSGFVADAFLANWDVVGLWFDNIVQSEDGFFRIDNGGSLIFRAQGGDKAYPPDSIPELQSMLNPEFPAGKVFADITEEEIKRQARELIKKLSPEDIRAIVDESGLEGEERERVLTGLLGRREYLVKKYGDPEDDNPESKELMSRREVTEKVRTVSEQEIERVGEKAIRPRGEIICDHDHIEGQKIDIINKKDQGTMEFSFKLRKPTEVMTAMIAKLKEEDLEGEITTPSGAVLSKGEIVYEASSSDESFGLCEAFVFEKEGVKVFIADPTARRKNGISHTFNPKRLIRTAIGLIKVETPADMNPEETERVLEEILEKDLGIPNALSEVPEENEEEYKLARYKWQHKIDGEVTPEQAEQAKKLERKEVFPGYTTLVEKGKHKEYLEKYGEDVRAVHRIGEDSECLYGVLTQGLMSTTERYARGMLLDGMSSITDMDTGGADSVFTRITNEAERNRWGGVLIVFKPEIFDRTDWYSYPNDTFGSTDDARFTTRLSPDELFTKTTNPNEAYPTGNEQMFRTGIGVEYIESIQVDPYSRDKIIAELHAMGLEEVNGRPIEEIIVSRETPKYSISPENAEPELDINPDIPKNLQIEPTPVLSTDEEIAFFERLLNDLKTNLKLESEMKPDIPEDPTPDSNES